MRRSLNLMRLRNRLPTAGLLVLALLPGCSGGFGFGGSSAPAGAAAPAPSPSLTDKVSSFFSGSSAKSPQLVVGAQTNIDCPTIDIRQGASTLTIGANGADNNAGAMSLKYQGTFVRAARECAVVDNQLVMKVGVQGRIIVGPAGGPGQVDVPLRLAVVRETTSGPRPILTKLVRIPVTVQSPTDNPTFTHIEEGLSFPMPPAADLDAYVVYIGFDPLAAEAQDKPKPKPRAKPKGRAVSG
jgi:hypothetical protein